MRRTRGGRRAKRTQRRSAFGEGEVGVGNFLEKMERLGCLFMMWAEELPSYCGGEFTV